MSLVLNRDLIRYLKEICDLRSSLSRKSPWLCVWEAVVSPQSRSTIGPNANRYRCGQDCSEGPLQSSETGLLDVAHPHRGCLGLSANIESFSNPELHVNFEHTS